MVLHRGDDNNINDLSQSPLDLTKMCLKIVNLKTGEDIGKYWIE